MKIKKENNKIFVVLDIGDEIMSSLKQLAKDENIPSASISGIGGIGDVTLGYFDLAQNKYLHKEFLGPKEAISLIGSITWFNNEPMAHLHVCLAGADYVPIAGHLVQGTITVTAELFLEVNQTRIERRPHEKLNFNKIIL